MSGAIPPLPNTPLWCGAHLNSRDNFTFTFTFILTYQLLEQIYSWEADSPFIGQEIFLILLESKFYYSHHKGPTLDLSWAREI
jgi:hypothetical protein